MKKYLLLIITIIPLQSATHSFYVGANVGVNTVDGKRNETVTNENRITTSLSINKGLNSKGIYGGILAGYLFRFQNFGIGPEIFYNYGNMENTVSGRQPDPAGAVTVFDVKHRITTSNGINARFGYFLESYFLYTLYGLQWQAYNYQVKARQDIADGNMPEYSHNTNNKRTTVISFGIGIQKQITENYDVGIEYRTFNLPQKNFEFNLGDGFLTKLTSTIKYRLHSVGLRFIYKF